MPQPPSQTDQLLAQLIAEVQALRIDLQKMCVLVLAVEFDGEHPPRGSKALDTWNQCVAFAKSIWNAGV